MYIFAVPFSELYEVGEEIGEGGFGTICEGIPKFKHEKVKSILLCSSNASYRSTLCQNMFKI